MTVDKTWTLNEALDTIRNDKFYDKVRKLNYHVMLGGSVLCLGGSSKDLDLFFSPLNGYEGDREGLFNLLNNTFGPLRSIRDSPDYHTDCLFHWREAQMGRFGSKRIDLFW